MKARIALVSASIALVTALALSGCAGGNKSSSKGSQGQGSDAEISVAFVPKVQGIPFFEAMNKGGAEAAQELGFKWVYSGATTADPAAQGDVVRSLIQQKVTALMVASNDPDSMVPLLKEAQDKGIKVGTADTDAPNSVREVFVTQATEDGIGTALLDQIAKPLQGQGEVAIVSCGQTAANLNAWIKVIKDKAPKKYPNLKIVDTVYADEDQAKAVSMAKDLMNANPNLKGIIGPCTTAAPGIAQAVSELGRVGKVFTTGVGTPKAMLPFLQSGASSASVLWNVEDHGYLTAWAGWQLAQGKEFQPVQDAGRIKGVKYDANTKTLLLGEPLILTKDNADEFNY